MPRLNSIAASALFISLPILWAANGNVARGDVLELTNGGRVEGRMVTDAAEDKSTHVIELSAGGRLTIPRSEVARVDSTSAGGKKDAGLGPPPAPTGGGRLEAR